MSSRALLQQLDGALEAGGKALDGLMAFLARESAREGRIDTERIVRNFQLNHSKWPFGEALSEIRYSQVKKDILNSKSGNLLQRAP